MACRAPAQMLSEHSKNSLEKGIFIQLINQGGKIPHRCNGFFDTDIKKSSPETGRFLPRNAASCYAWAIYCYDLEG
jgi:hypothetical protein